MVNLSKIDLNLLVVIDAIYAEGGITKAAERLHLTQPAVSRALSRLRDLFNDPVFERQGHRMVPTAMTQHLIGPLRENLRSLGALLNETKSFDAKTSKKRFVVGLRGFMEAAVMPWLVRSAARDAPDVGLVSFQHHRRDLEADLVSGTLDVAIDVMLPLSEAVKFTRISADRMVVVARKGHPTMHGAIDMKAYLAQRHILVTPRRTGPGFEDVELRRLGLQR